MVLSFEIVQWWFLWLMLPAELWFCIIIGKLWEAMQVNFPFSRLFCKHLHKEWTTPNYRTTPSVCQQTSVIETNARLDISLKTSASSWIFPTAHHSHLQIWICFDFLKALCLDSKRFMCVKSSGMTLRCLVFSKGKLQAFHKSRKWMNEYWADVI